jgi:hypothetical protein
MLYISQAKNKENIMWTTFDSKGFVVQGHPINIVSEH